jgi:prophage regulatory protein
MLLAEARKAAAKTISDILELEAAPRRKLLAAALPEMLVRLDCVCAITGLSPATVHRLKAVGDFPRPVKLTGYARAWKLSEVLGWIESRERDVGGDTAETEVSG